MGRGEVGKGMSVKDTQESGERDRSNAIS